MKDLSKLLLPLLAIVVAFSSCKNGRSWFGGSSADTLCTDTYKFDKVDSTAERVVEVKIEADYPAAITGPLSANVASWIRSNIGKDNTTLAPDTMNGQKVVDFFGKQIFDSYAGEEVYPSSMSYIASAKLVCKRRNYVSYVLNVYEYTGGAHGMTAVSGATFSQIDGRQYGWELLKDTAKTGFHKLMKKGVRKYFSSNVAKGEITDEELCGMLLLNIDGAPGTAQQLDRFPLPSNPPYFTRKGVNFVYSSYEIAPYAAGIPAFVIDFEDIKDYLSKEGKALIKKKDK